LKLKTARLGADLLFFYQRLYFYFFATTIERGFFSKSK